MEVVRFFSEQVGLCGESLLCHGVIFGGCLLMFQFRKCSSESRTAIFELF